MKVRLVILAFFYSAEFVKVILHNYFTADLATQVNLKTDSHSVPLVSKVRGSRSQSRKLLNRRNLLLN